MADVVRKEPVLIENVNLIINVYNIGRDGLGNLPGNASNSNGQHEPPSERPREAPDSNSKDGSIAASCSVQGSTTKLYEPIPLGWIANNHGDVIPFGVLRIETELPSLGDSKTWKEIRVCLPPSLLADNETDLYCPVSSCREKLARNKSMDSHIKKHLGLINKKAGAPINTNNDDGLPCPLVYYCQDKKCQYYVETAEKFFKAYKNVKQHYQKVHAPRPFECELCKKTFLTHKIAETHKLMCGEKYSCSTCDSSYNSLEALQTHCRRKVHVYDHIKYKDMRNSVKQEMQSLKTSTPPTNSTVTSSGRRTKGSRKLPVILPKVSSTSGDEVFKNIQALIQRAGVKVDYGCQTVCTAIIQKSTPIQAQAVISSTTQPIPQKKRKSTDTQTNIVKFRATCLDQKHNATNTNLDWKKVITSDTQTQTADSCDSNSSPSPLAACDSANDKSALMNDEFATIKISESIPIGPKVESDDISKPSCTESLVSSSMVKKEVLEKGEEHQVAVRIEEDGCTGESKVSKPKGGNGPSVFQEFISFLEATDCATQTEPDIFENLGGDLLGINVNLEDFSGTEKHTYVSVSSTASQTAVENIARKSLSAEDYEALLSTTDNKTIDDLQVISEFTKEGSAENVNSENPLVANDELLDWENIVEEVYRDVDSESKVSNSQL